MTWRNSKADSIVWIVEGNHDRTSTVFARIYVPKTIIVFGIFLESMIRLRPRLSLSLRPAVDSSEAFFYSGIGQLTALRVLSSTV